jgi:hypothetical protein
LGALLGAAPTGTIQNCIGIPKNSKVIKVQMTEAMTRCKGKQGRGRKAF